MIEVFFNILEILLFTKFIQNASEEAGTALVDAAEKVHNTVEPPNPTIGLQGNQRFC